ncbi:MULTISPECIES: GNAT family N-acetyltransferase [unclassified Breznakia]|uniref:GNAT family N-acetyltransferase n=1 Tax=unclassified Breznakia TaxID=2623764 RepID=UPI0024747639|nr:MULTISPECIES: GNAT family N-acetyltransferase [unclassified Breznakia]MDH6367803.1 uncharacterized protein (DUF952 family)/RimJ/RimL family protein N-acetyltransferase [Breznakia sp. PH1-1]MDH6404900.1 uncharacterized protein (DUF952 family)/RimJ/RimL family protein N-acetyltransferase [Breznakia sp. PF1-11]MDH6412606.1 uncharacterized protein (DUF952 family)/RimJ/RimL family protein N-acetyltransferase [Breznakia sp. PFB1-11]MDH6414975.1 uncharacterized protein (DUF952 family)/RimJ/RimL fam
MTNTTGIIIQKTNENDLQNIQNLWNNGEVMKYVGFPNGLQISEESIHNWYMQSKQCQDNRQNHYSIYDKELGYCGEAAFFMMKDSTLAALDIKLVPSARGKGIAFEAITYAINQAFQAGSSLVWVDPHPDNQKAIVLYERLGFQRNEMPERVKAFEDVENMQHVPVYMELTRENWPSRIYHMLPKAVYESCKDQEFYTPEDYAQDGFIHFSLKDQLIRVAQACYNKYEEMLIFEVIVNDEIRKSLKMEGLEGEVFPHLYMPLPLANVQSIHRIYKDANGQFALDF